MRVATNSVANNSSVKSNMRPFADQSNYNRRKSGIITEYFKGFGPINNSTLILKTWILLYMTISCKSIIRESDLIGSQSIC